jgi:glycosyltransferase involved in cell wall biosynthesis
VTFLVTGTIAPAGRDGFVAAGLLDDFGQALAAADCAVCPIEFGGGTKIKLLEGLAAGLPTVAFAEALHGLDLDDEVLVAAKNDDALLAGVEQALRPEVAADLSARGRAWVAANHDWRAIAARLEERLLALADQTAAVGAGAGSSCEAGSNSIPTTSYTSS